MQKEGFWYSVGDFFYTCFEGLEWASENLHPHYMLIAVGFGFFGYWLFLQGRFNKEAARKGTLK